MKIRASSLVGGDYTVFIYTMLGQEVLRKTRNSQPATESRSPFVTILICMAFIFILIFQMEHVASIGMDVSVLNDET